MEPRPQELEQDVLIRSQQPPPLDLVVTGSCNGLLEGLIVLGHLPITIVVIWDVSVTNPALSQSNLKSDSRSS